ncbi:hypothetical protein ACVWZ4_001172 [Bradyrhizobium sp. USDA 4472]
MHDGIDLLGIARGHRDGVRTLEVAIHLVMTGEAITSAEQERREQSQIPDGHLSLALVEGFHDRLVGNSSGRRRKGRPDLGSDDVPVRTLHFTTGIDVIVVALADFHLTN